MMLLKESIDGTGLGILYFMMNFWHFAYGDEMNAAEFLNFFENVVSISNSQCAFSHEHVSLHLLYIALHSSTHRR